MVSKPSGPAPLVSVITPTLNQAGYLESTLASVRHQTYERVEHVVVDGGSTDGTIATLAAHKVRWISEPDDGMYEAVNKGLGLAAGEILCYLNSDDLLLPWAVKTVVDAFRRHPEWDLVYGDALRYYEELDAVDLLLQVPFHFSVHGRTSSFVQPAVFWRRRVVDTLGTFDASLRLSADLDYWLRASREVSIGRVEEVLAVERAHGGGQTARLTARLRDEATVVRARYHADGRSRRLKKLGARIVLEMMVRLQMLRYAAAPGRRRWRRFRDDLRPTIRWRWFAVALVTPRPLVGAGPRSLSMRLLRGRWLGLDTARLLEKASGEGRR